jgi:glycerol-3-phosphate dehydrogenase (NAD(P)+)
MKLAIIGAGSWGTVLSQILNDNGHEIVLWSRTAAKAQAMAFSHCNVDYLPHLKLSPKILITNDLELAVRDAQVLIFVVPSKAMSSVAEKVAQITSCEDKIVLSCTKGIDPVSYTTMSKILSAKLPRAKHLAVMSGPNLAGEIALRQPSATVIACKDLAVAEQLQGLFINKYFRPYTSTDILGVELCGALKNCMAIVAGMMCGLGFGDNSLAALITRGLAEIKRLGLRLGAQQETFQGLAGVGDLIATCISSQSRNHLAGEALAKGKSLSEIQTNSKMVIEGIMTTKAAHALAARENIEMPIIEQLYQVLFDGKDVQEALVTLMSRTGKKE